MLITWDLLKVGLVQTEKLANAKKEMTTAQAARFLRIQAKYLKAISKANSQEVRDIHLLT